MVASAKSSSRRTRRQARRAMPALRRTAQRLQAVARRTPLTLGELVAAAFDTAGGELREAVRVMSAPQMERALGRRIVVVR